MFVRFHSSNCILNAKFSISYLHVMYQAIKLNKQSNVDLNNKNDKEYQSFNLPEQSLK